MRIIRYTHSCVRVEVDGIVLVIDPGVWSEPRALHGADAVLVTHEHVDHVDTMRLRGLAVQVFAPVTANLPGVNVTGVTADQAFSAAGVGVLAVGGQHASVWDGQSSCANLGYVVDGRLYHPGDALHVPSLPVDTLLAPMQASWLKTAEAIRFVRAVSPRLAIGIHDAQLNERGRSSINGWLAEEGSADYRWLAPGTAVDRS
ncbi:MAG TPA: MBL fold metallo-hydrolase [Euzebya sp.]|nr:MBL fold metallo-hydrolase [Euzebya sp.]